MQVTQSPIAACVCDTAVGPALSYVERTEDALRLESWSVEWTAAGRLVTVSISCARHGNPSL